MNHFFFNFIAHRGNIDGPKPEEENNPRYILNAIDRGYDVEIDVWHLNRKYYLGHDKPQYEVDYSFLASNPVWCHAKNIEAMQQLLNDELHYFWHENDQYTLTSKGIPWCYPGFYHKKGIAVINQNKTVDLNKLVGIGICSDYCNFYKSEFK